MTSNAKIARPGRWFLFLGLLAVVAGPALYAAQMLSHNLSAAWYFPVLVTLGVLLIATSFVQSRTIVRGVAAGFTGLFAAMAWLITFAMPTPEYTGPVTVGEAFPAFETKLAAGGSFQQGDLKGGKDTVLVFFRGKW